MTKPHSLSTTALVVWLCFGFFMFFGLPALSVMAVVLPSALGPSVNWKIAGPFLALFDGWWFYVLYRGAQAVLARREAEKKRETAEQRAARGETDA